jgi:hypothetical protein
MSLHPLINIVSPGTYFKYEYILLGYWKFSPSTNYHFLERTMVDGKRDNSFTNPGSLVKKGFIKKVSERGRGISGAYAANYSITEEGIKHLRERFGEDLDKAYDLAVAFLNRKG